jgi:hypothetical protein
MKDIKNETIRTLKVKHLANVLPDGDFDHRKICCNQIEVDKTYLNNLLDAVWEAASEAARQPDATRSGWRKEAQIAYNAKWGLVDANERYKKLSPEELERYKKLA